MMYRRFERIRKHVLDHSCFVSVTTLLRCLGLSVLHGYTITCPSYGGGMQLGYVVRSIHQVSREIMTEDGTDVSFSMKVICHEPEQHDALLHKTCRSLPHSVHTITQCVHRRLEKYVRRIKTVKITRICILVLSFIEPPVRN